jgi:ABC-type dipeptide/oligopeptide/nickel transport system ATPase subunit
MGGTLAAIESGYLQKQIQDSAYVAQQALDAGAAVMVGVNRYVDDSPGSTRVFQIDPDVEREQIAVCASSARAAARASGGRRSTPSTAPLAAATIWCQQSLLRSRRVPHWAKSPPAYAGCSASIRRRHRERTPGCAAPHGDFRRRTRHERGDDVSFTMAAGETLGLVGESGSGKSVTAFSILRLLQPPGQIVSGRILFEGRDLLTLAERDMRAVRGARISADLSGADDRAQPGDACRRSGRGSAHRPQHGEPQRGAPPRLSNCLTAVPHPRPERRVRDYPHQLSGGMRQRVMIAIALACRPPLVIADEPTTALDVTIQAQMLELIRDLQTEFGLALLLITHDLASSP